ncbi:FAD-binding protein [Marinobacterium sediminicola]|uniref:3-oxo-5alpha-steroid 4-dehydrogenase n=1 Tax=Marinobacterium sediminicola TaxID=518898 RepID=A0ABY1S4G8_9GAMM|nr:FAD-binding protein [Marinobacterium sediminicola]ULG70141.1 FAD-binding protein [Marinobacterium sediminicola]SMR78416.1 3-oxo-5alpha-steroid 4-dehydrogenase [Marinobacterium sediminicola]
MSGSAITEIGPPLEIENPDSQSWDRQCDVLVVGWGAAGACAAIEAHDQGAEVIVVDRFQGGGASAKSGGVVYAGGGTKHQQQAGFEDTPAAMYDYLKHETQGVVSDATLKRFCDDSVANLKWLEAMGTPYTHTMPPGGKTSYPQDGYYLYYSGNELVPAYRGELPPPPRGHRTVGKGHGGVVLYSHLQAACRQRGIASLTQSAVRRLVVDADNRVIGAEVWSLPVGSKAARLHAKWGQRAEKLQNLAPGYCNRLRGKLATLEHQHARRVLVRARKGVILSTGGFIFNKELVKHFAPKYRRNFKIGATGCDGSGLRLGMSVGAEADRLDTVSAWRFINPPQKWPKGIAVNTRGERFCNEEVYGATLGHAICEKQNGNAWLILDKPLRRQSIRQALFGGYWWFQSVPALVMMLLGAKKGKTPAELARKTGMDSALLEASLRDYNQAISSGQHDPMGKSADSCQPLRQGPFYALDISVSSTVLPLGALTLGGLKVDEQSGQVLDADARPLAGLYAAGRTAVGIPSNLYISGLSLADCVFSGRRAGAAAAAGDTSATREAPEALATV